MIRDYFVRPHGVGAVCCFGNTTVSGNGFVMQQYYAGSGSGTPTTVYGRTNLSYSTATAASGAVTIANSITLIPSQGGAGVAITMPGVVNGMLLWIVNNDTAATTGAFAIPANTTWAFVGSGGAWRRLT